MLAFATAGLALSTRSLARKTADEVKHSGRLVEASQRQVYATLEQARTAQDALAAAARAGTESLSSTLDRQVRPVLVEASIGPVMEHVTFPEGFPPRGLSRGTVVVEARDGVILLSLPLRNAGTGLATIRGARLMLPEDVVQPPVLITPVNVPAHEYGRVAFSATPNDMAYQPLWAAILARRPPVEVDYVDLAGQQATVSRLLVHASDVHGPWDVRVSLH